MDSNFKLNQLYVFSDLTIAKVVNEHYSYPTFKETRRGKEFAVDINSRTFKCTELFFKIEEKYKLNLRQNYYANSFLTDLFQLAFHRYSDLIEARRGYDATLLHRRNHFNCALKYENKFILMESGKQVEHILISNFDKKVAEPMLKKHNRLFECL